MKCNALAFHSDRAKKIRNHQDGYPEPSIFLVQLIGQLISDSEGQGIAWDIKKKYFPFLNSTKNGTKVATIYNAVTLLYI